MTIESVIYATLSNAPLLAGIPIRPVVVEQTDQPPYIAFQKIHEERPSDLRGDSGIANPKFQIDAYAQTNLQATTLRDAIRSAILANPALNAVVVGGSSMFDMQTRLYREMQDYSMWFYDQP